MKIFTCFALCCSLFFCNSCEKKARVHDLSPKGESVKVILSDEDEKSIQAFEGELSQAFVDGDAAFFDDRFNVKELLAIAVKGLDIKGNKRKSFLAGVKDSEKQIKTTLSQTFLTSEMTYLKTVHETKPALLYRVLMADNSFTYCEFHLAKRSSRKKWEIVDLYLYANGENSSALIRQNWAQMMPRHGGLDKAMSATMGKVRQIQVDTQNGDYDKAWRDWKTIDSKFYNNRSVLMTGYVAAFQSFMSDFSKTDRLEEVVGVMQKNFPGDGGFAIMELAIHEINKDYDKYRDSISKLRSKVGEDSFLDLLELTAEHGEKNYDKVISVATSYLEEDPDSLYAHDFLIYAHAGKKDYSALGEALSEYKEYYELDTELLLEDAELVPFFESAQGKDWLKARAEKK